MNRDLVAPLDTDDESFPCPACGGSGLEETGNGDVILCKTRCDFCNGSGYGPPPPVLDREVSHCLQRLAAWAHRDTIKQEN